MTGYGQFCAVARALEVLGERWTLLIVRELLLGAATYTDLRRGLPRIPRATLAARLRALTGAGVVEATGGGYRLTAAGAALAPTVQGLAAWATGAGRLPLADEHLDTAALTWDIQRRVDVAALPERTVVVAVEFTDRTVDRHHWLHLARTGVNLCREDTGAPVDVWLAAPLRAATRWWLGELTWAGFLRQPSVRVHGDPALVRRMPHWFLGYLLRADDDAATKSGRG
ncbi:helix-turn-helix domain-containing protein [Micromonospora sp. NPDC126480]|uniref:winged helix-turn-helix transcriptional regulator n=1 Tax=Micromonospora sp. NPDC126480 TaxID=3155312 RepID=UPI00332D2305